MSTPKKLAGQIYGGLVRLVGGHKWIEGLLIEFERETLDRAAVAAENSSAPYLAGVAIRALSSIQDTQPVSSPGKALDSEEAARGVLEGVKIPDPDELKSSKGKKDEQTKYENSMSVLQREGASPEVPGNSVPSVQRNGEGQGVAPTSKVLVRDHDGRVVGEQVGKVVCPKCGVSVDERNENCLSTAALVDKRTDELNALKAQTVLSLAAEEAVQRSWNNGSSVDWNDGVSLFAEGAAWQEKQVAPAATHAPGCYIDKAGYQCCTPECPTRCLSRPDQKDTK